MKLAEAECLTCHLATAVNRSESEISLFLRKHPLVRGIRAMGGGGGESEAPRSGGKVVLPQVEQCCLFLNTRHDVN